MSKDKSCLQKFLKFENNELAFKAITFSIKTNCQLLAHDIELAVDQNIDRLSITDKDLEYFCEVWDKFEEFLLCCPNFMYFVDKKLDEEDGVKSE